MAAIEGPPRPYMNYLPEILKESAGKWIMHEVVEPGVIAHTDTNGKKLFTVHTASPPNGRYSTDTLRKISALARKYGGNGMRFTQAYGMEFIVKDLDAVKNIKGELKSLGFPVGGWGGHLWNMTSCAGYFHCALAAVDAPSLLQAIGNDLSKYFNEEELPAKLAISVSGCPSSCGNSFLPDISIGGIHTEIPVVTEAAKNCDIQGTAFSCPVGAIQLKPLPDGTRTLEIRESLCIGCGLCLGACGGIIFQTPEKTDGHALMVGGKAAASRQGTTLGRVVVPFLPNDVPHYTKTVKAVRKIVETWKEDAKKGERMADWIERIGWEKFFERTGLPFFEQSMEYLDIRGITTLRNVSGR